VPSRNSIKKAPATSRAIGEIAELRCGLSDFICEVYQANFVYGQNISQTETIESILKKLQLDSQSIIEMSTTEPAKQALKYNGLHAEQLRIFGAPSFIVNGELFWGNDRLQDALDWSKRIV